MLDQPFSTIIREFLANSTDLQRVIWKNYLGESESDEKIATIIAANIITDISYIRQDGDIKAGVHSIIIIKHPFSVAAAPIILIIVNEIIEYSIFIDIGAELNVITIYMIDKAGLAIRTRVKVKILLYSEHISRFLKMIKNILISIGLVVYRVNIFVTRSVS